jgi:hypothetical protein
MNDIMENENVKYLVIKKHLMVIITDSTLRLRRNVPMPWQRGNGGSAAAVLGWSRIGGGGGGILVMVAAEWQALQRR